VYGRTRAEAQQRVKAILKIVGAGVPVRNSPTLGAYLSDWLIAIQPRVRPKTFVSYEGTVRRHITPYLGKQPIDRLTPQQIAALLTHKTQQGLSSRSVKYTLDVLRLALGRAVKWGVVMRNVAALVDAPRIRHRPVTVLTPEQARQLTEAARGDRLEALYLVGLSLGLRLGEVLGLKWSDIDLAKRELRVQRALQRQTGKGLLEVETKTDRSRRALIMPIVLEDALRRWQVTQNLERHVAGSLWHRSDFVFTTTFGTPQDQSDVNRSFHKLLSRAGLQRIRFHDLRHSCASLLLAQGMSPRVVMETLGHSRIALTMDIYSHVLPALKRDAADAMDRVLDQDR
jgi:integrase